MKIGDWVRSSDGRRTVSKWHLVESVVAGDALTRCGRRMEPVTRSGDELQISAVVPLTRAIGQPQLSKAGCDDNIGDGFEDDASTHDEMVP